MVRILALVMLTSMAFGQSPSPQSTATQSTPADAGAVAAPQPSAGLGELPAPPPGKSTVIGGEIRAINPVLDEITLKVFGGQSMKILFDERTKVYVNGKRIPVLDLRPSEHASVETTLDGTKVFALRIHMLTQLPEGDARGQVISYDSGNGRLRISSTLSQRMVTLTVPPNTPVVRTGQTAFTSGGGGAADLTPGALIDVKFEGNGQGAGVATHIDVLATNGATFVFSGVLTYFDIGAGRLTIDDPRDNQTYEVYFDPAQFSQSSQLHQGSHLQVTASFNGSRYTATAITIE
ncbi:MAG TPA: DUF5666 domain-containing protein [Acidobacteriaceae bacterium]|nr:DUF5666 domain-containing protein [Acidobacteriaceae bacterium]HTX40749.1 DUF5666 domain-containing protein [Acidobacteriaceae bacterium]